MESLSAIKERSERRQTPIEGEPQAPSPCSAFHFGTSYSALVIQITDRPRRFPHYSYTALSLVLVIR